MIMRYLCVITFLVASATAFLHNLDHHLLHLNLDQTDLSTVQRKKIEQPLDHFDPNEKRIFNITYYENLQFWSEGGPIYIYIATSGVVPIWVVDDKYFTPQAAKATNGAIFAAEHRYYGYSFPDIPTDDTIEYFKFMNSYQALEDLASLIKKLKSDPKFKSSKVVAVGSKYAGNLATWMRELHPELVDAAVAISAPLLAKKDFKEYFDNVRDTIGKYGTKDCLEKIEKDFNRTEELFKTKKGREDLKRELHICPESDLTVLENQQLVIGGFKYSFVRFIVEALPYRIKDYCKQIESIYHPNPILLMASRPSSHRCVFIDYQNFDYTQSNFAESMNQYCTEFCRWPTTTSEKQPFVHWSPLEYFIKICKGFIKGDVEKAMDESVAKANQRYGGLAPNVTKVVFTHGDMDPWRVLGVVKDLGPDAPAIIVNGTSSWGFLYEDSREPKEMKEARKYVIELIRKWIAN